MSNKNARWYSPANKDFSIDRIIKNGGYYDKDGIWNSILLIDGNLYRGRVETLILDGDNIFMQLTKTGYRIPGGSFELNVKNINQAIAECREEARINVKNIVNTGIHYLHNFKDKFEPQPGKIFWDGTYNEVYIAEYDSIYTGPIYDLNRDDEIYQEGRFYPLIMVKDKLTEPHRKALDGIISSLENNHSITIPDQIEESSLIKEDEVKDNFFNLDPLHENSIGKRKIKAIPYYTVEEMKQFKVFHKYGNVYSDNADVSDLLPFYESYTKGIVPDNYYDMLIKEYNNYCENPCNENKQRILCLGYNPEIAISDSIIERVNLDRNKSHSPEIIDLTENYIFSKKDDVYNFDRWENGDYNILFVTGLSGSGKSILADDLADEYEATVIHLDHIQCYERFLQNKKETETTKLIKKYLKLNKDLKCSDFNNILNKDFEKIYKEMIPWLLKELEKDKNTKYIVEGVHIMLFMKYKDIKKYPLICINTSMTKSIFRHWIRDRFTIPELVQYGLEDVKLFTRWENSYNDFKDDIISNKK